jgi:hypothetical protein
MLVYLPCSEPGSRRWWAFALRRAAAGWYGGFPVGASRPLLAVYARSSRRVACAVTRRQVRGALRAPLKYVEKFSQADRPDRSARQKSARQCAVPLDACPVKDQVRLGTDGMQVDGSMAWVVSSQGPLMVAGAKLQVGHATAARSSSWRSMTTSSASCTMGPSCPPTPEPSSRKSPAAALAGTPPTRSRTGTASATMKNPPGKEKGRPGAR